MLLYVLGYFLAGLTTVYILGKYGDDPDPPERNGLLSVLALWPLMILYILLVEIPFAVYKKGRNKRAPR